MDDLFANRSRLALEPGATLLGGIETLAKSSPFRQLETPGGRRMSVAMTNAGQQGWISDRRGYGYAPVDPLSSGPWQTMPAAFADLARDAAEVAGFNDFARDACLINRYEPGSRMSLHQDRDERDLTQPIVSVSLGVEACFLSGGPQRSDRPQRIALHHGDVVVWGGPARLMFHGIDTLTQAVHPLTGMVRYNLTFRVAR